MNVPTWIFLGFQQRNRPDSQNLNDGTFCRLRAVTAQAIIGTEKYLDAGILIIYDDDDDYSQGYAQIKEAFRALTEDHILEPYMSHDGFRTSNVRADDVGYNLYVFDIKY